MQNRYRCNHKKRIVLKHQSRTDSTENCGVMKANYKYIGLLAMIAGGLILSFL